MNRPTDAAEVARVAVEMAHRYGWDTAEGARGRCGVAVELVGRRVPSAGRVRVWRLTPAATGPLVLRRCGDVLRRVPVDGWAEHTALRVGRDVVDPTARQFTGGRLRWRLAEWERWAAAAVSDGAGTVTLELWDPPGVLVESRPPVSTMR